MAGLIIYNSNKGRGQRGLKTPLHRWYPLVALLVQPPRSRMLVEVKPRTTKRSPANEWQYHVITLKIGPFVILTILNRLILMPAIPVDEANYKRWSASIRDAIPLTGESAQKQAFFCAILYDQYPPTK